MHHLCALKIFHPYINKQLVIIAAPMNESKFFEQIFSAITRVLPPGSAEVEKNVRASLQGVFDRLKLVTREEIEVQEAVLTRTRARLQELEKKVAELEKKLAQK